MICRASIKRRRMPSLIGVQFASDDLANIDAIRAAGAPMSKVDLCVYRAQRKSGDAWIVKIFGRHVAEFTTRDPARTLADFAPLLIAQGTCPVCLTKHDNLRAHVGGAECLTSVKEVKTVNPVKEVKPVKTVKEGGIEA
ncbi:MAG: hypothetical protein RLZZ341_2444 [Pseudomonadota bacterium]|jgi:hypothetical protein